MTGAKMRTQGDTAGEDWHATEMFMRRKLPLLVIVANFTGACVVSSYFIYFDQIRPLSQTGIMMWVIVSMLIALLVLGFTLTHRWQKSLVKFVRLKQHNSEIEPALIKSAQRKILDLPFVSALTSLFCWFWATVIMAIYRIVDPLDEIVFPASLVEAYRVAIGVIIAGIITCAIIFLASEIMCRRIWPYFFPQGGLTQTTVTFRLKLRARTFIIFTLASILPIILMAVLSYNHAKLMLEAPQGEVIQSLLAMTAFLLIVTLS
jgi:sigma-B regulation protein RsbU (phosphoserine phosphatase)